MRSLQFFSKKGLNLLVATLFIFGSRIQNVKAEGECAVFENAMKKLGQEALLKEQTVQVCCNYTQVTCDNIQGKLHITEVKLEKINTFHGGSETDAVKELSNLPFLSTLEIIDSNYGKIPEGLDKLTNLKTLILSGNGYHETLPPVIGNLTNLEILDLSRGFMTGDIPKEYCNLVNLKILNLSDQRLTGVIPYCFKDLKELETLNLKKNLGLKGYVPNFSKISNCDYQYTDLCTSKNAKCRSNSKTCNENDIKSTNSINGNPDPNSNKIDDIIDNYAASNGRPSGDYDYDHNHDYNRHDNDNIVLNYIYNCMFMKILAFVFIFALSAIIQLSTTSEKKSKNKKENNNELINDSNNATTRGGDSNVTLTVTSTESTKKTNDNRSDISDDDNKPILLAFKKNQQSTSENVSVAIPQPVVSPVVTLPATTTAYVTPPVTVAYVPPTMPGVAYDPQMPGIAYVAQPVSLQPSAPQQ